MSWYHKRLAHIDKFQQAQGRIVSMNLKITSPLTDQDAKFLIGGLNKLQGVKAVHVEPEVRKVTITYQSGEISIEEIAYAIAKMGYNYIHRT